MYLRGGVQRNRECKRNLMNPCLLSWLQAHISHPSPLSALSHFTSEDIQRVVINQVLISPFLNKTLAKRSFFSLQAS